MMSEQETWFWTSFADPELPEGSQFLGVAILRAHDSVSAALTAHMLGINPGGEVAGGVLPPDLTPPVEWRERLLTRSEAEQLDVTLGEIASRRAMH